MNMNFSPCMNCADRQFGCFVSCEKYKAWKTEYDEAQRKIREAKDKAGLVDNFKADIVEKTKKRSRR